MKPLCIAVSGLHCGENPQPGSGIIRSLRRAWPGVHIVGLVHDVMESGIYVEDGPDEIQLMPYPAAGAMAFFQRLDVVHKKTPIDVLIPSLDTEIELLVHHQKDFAKRGIRVCLPEAISLRRRAKQFLPQLARNCGVAVPKSRVAHDALAAYDAAVVLGLPLLVKGPYDDARTVYSLPHAQAVAAHLLAEWGTPVILQRRVTGTEFNVLGIGDGQGGIVAQCSIRKTATADKRRGLGGVVVRDSKLDALCEALIRELRWNGPFEIELIQDAIDHRYVLIEINPRFPSWIDFPAMLGANFAAALVERLLESAPAHPLPACQPGAFFLRHQIEVVDDVSRYSGLRHDDVTPSSFAHPGFRLSAPFPGSPRDVSVH